MRLPGLPVPRPSVRALWLGRGALGLVFVGLLLGGALSPLEALSLSLALALAAGVGWLSAPAPTPLRRLWPAALAFLIVIGVAVLTVTPLPQPLVRSGLFAAVGGRTLSIAPAATVIEIAKLFGLGSAFLCGVFAGRGGRTPDRLLDSCVVFTGFWAAWSVALFASSGEPTRLGAPLLSPNTAACLMGVGVILGLGRLLAWRDATRTGGQRGWRLAWLGGAITIMVVALLLTQSRAGLVVSTLCSIGLVASWPTQSNSPGRPQRWLVAGGAALAMLIIFEAGQGVLLRLPGLTEAAADRQAIFAIYWRAFLDAPVFGSGLGSATYVTKLGMTPQTYEALWNVQSAHNWALQWLAEGGIATAAPLWIAVGGLILAAVRGLDDRSTRWLLPLLFADVVVLSHGLTDFALQIPAFALYWSFLLGLQFAVSGGRPSGDASPAAGRRRETGS